MKIKTSGLPDVFFVCCKRLFRCAIITFMKVILASASPRRKELLKKLVKGFLVIPSEFDENIPFDEASEYAKKLSFFKAEEVFKRFCNDIVIGADTIVVLDGKILGKPHDEAQAKIMLDELSGRSHFVITGVTVMSKQKTVTFAEISTVTFKKLTDTDIENYIKTGSPFDKAGGYGIQDSGFVEKISGSFDNVVGLPVEKLGEVLKQFGGLNG